MNHRSPENASSKWKNSSHSHPTIRAGVRLVAIALLSIAGTLPAHAWKFEFILPTQGLTTSLAQGESLDMQVLVDEEILEVINPDGTKKMLFVDLEWIAPGSSQPLGSCFPTVNKPCLPSFTKMAGPFPDKAFRSERFRADRSAFPYPGLWAVRARLRNTSIGLAILHIKVEPEPKVHKDKPYPVGPELQPANPVSKPALVSPPSAGRSEGGKGQDKQRGRLERPLSADEGEADKGEDSPRGRLKLPTR